MHHKESDVELMSWQGGFESQLNKYTEVVHLCYRFTVVMFVGVEVQMSN